MTNVVRHPLSVPVVVALGQDHHHHGLDPRACDWSLCGAVPVTADMARDSQFAFDGDDDCGACGRRLADPSVLRANRRLQRTEARSSLAR